MLDYKKVFSPELIKQLTKQHYSLFGHSGAKLCHWTKESILHDRVCYKQKFYGIQSHRCLQMSPNVSYCNQECVFCWRPLTTIGTSMKKFDEPQEIVEASIKAQQKLLSGYKGILDRINKKKLEEAFKPNQVAISLNGEPTLYPKLDELIKEYKKNKFTTFVVSNGLKPKILEKLKPTQLYMSLDAPSKELHLKINHPLIKNSWQLINKSLSAFSGMKVRRVIRITLINNLNDKEPENYAKLIEKSNTDFVEIKSFMSVGFARERLGYGRMPSHEQTLKFALDLNNSLNFKLIGQQPSSRVVLLSSQKRKAKISKDD